MNAQGEDVVAGIRTPQTIDQLKEVSPQAYQKFSEISKALKRIIKICRIWNLRLKKENCICCRQKWKTLQQLQH